MGFTSMVTNVTREPNLGKYRMHIKCSYQHQLHKINSQKTAEGDDGWEKCQLGQIPKLGSRVKLVVRASQP